MSTCYQNKPIYLLQFAPPTSEIRCRQPSSTHYQGSIMYLPPKLQTFIAHKGWIAPSNFKLGLRVGLVYHRAVDIYYVKIWSAGFAIRILILALTNPCPWQYWIGYSQRQPHLCTMVFGLERPRVCDSYSVLIWHLVVDPGRSQGSWSIEHPNAYPKMRNIEAHVDIFQEWIQSTGLPLVRGVKQTKKNSKSKVAGKGIFNSWRYKYKKIDARS